MSFQQGLSGLNAAAKNLDVIGNNVANANTVGFKSSVAQFADVYASSLGGSGGTQAGIGVGVTAIAQQFSQGNISSTSNPLDVAINGDGFFRLDKNGSVSYTRAGQFQLDKDGYITNATGSKVMGYPVGPNGQVVASTPVDLQLSRADISPAATTTSAVNMNLDSRMTAPTAAFKATDPTTYNSSTSMSVYDSLGNAHTMSLYFRKTAANSWDVYAANDGTAVGAGAVGTIKFTTAGAVDTTATTLPFNLSSALTNGAATPMAFALDLSGATQFGSAFTVNSLSQDGFASGKLTGFSIAADGTVEGRYSNGQTRAQGQLVLANFTNPNGLQPLGNSQWAETTASGQPQVGAPDTGTLGALQSGAVEESNVDLTAELVNMITAQRVYQANAQTIKTEDSVMQTLVNLR